MSQPKLFDNSQEPPVFTVGQFLDLMNEMLGAQDFFVMGEVVGAKPHPTGFYFSLKDKDGGGIVDCYLSPYAYRGLGFIVEDGMEVKVGGAPSIYKAKGRFSFRVESLEVAGEGTLKKLYDALKKKLQEEGLFDRKRQLPAFISRIGLITSRSGAVIEDFRRNLAHLGLQVSHYDVRVEGVQAVPQIRRALEWFNTHSAQFDVVVVIRGGGSMEDLQAFNDEQIVRSIFGLRIPTVISIGHDRDVPLAQMAADASGSTPTATAHIINDTWAPLTQQVPRAAQRLMHAYESALSSARADADGLTHRLMIHCTRISGRGRELAHKLKDGLRRIGAQISHIGQIIQAAERQLASANPERQLALGYSIVTDEMGGVISSSAQLRHGQMVTTRLSRGSFTGEVKELQSEKE
jgi:exodeoxyribonuclease VII large subunit